MMFRRLGFSAAVLTTMAAMILLAARALAPDGIGALDTTLLVLFALTLPWSVIGFWNATLGLLAMRLVDDPEGTAVPLLRHRTGDGPLASRTAILFCVRNEAPERLVRNLAAMLDDLAASGHGAALHLFVLSDTDDPTIGAAEEEAVAALARRHAGRIAVTYRRRADNAGFKAGNIGDFCTRWGRDHDFAITLDADSLMSAVAMIRLIRLMEAAPKLGILQTLVVGLPSTSAFARLFQFGMRLGMRSYTLGSTLWQGACGPYWGHNAIIRLAPFIAHCDMPALPGGATILSHDQVEAALMRRAGYEVRVLPAEGGSWEENPPTLTEFIRRDLRWCRGNMQYWRLLGLPGLHPVSRYQFVFAILMFITSPAWLLLAVLAGLTYPFGLLPVDPAAGWPLLVLAVAMGFAPKIASVADTLAQPDLRRAFGGTGRFLLSTLLETLFTLMLSPVTTVAVAIYLMGLPFGRALSWAAQVRDDHMVPPATALRALWPQTLLGLAGLAWTASLAPHALWLVVVMAGPLALSVPFALLTSWPALGRAMARRGIGRLPEETDPPVTLRALSLPAVSLAGHPLPASSVASEAA